MLIRKLFLTLLILAVALLIIMSWKYTLQNDVPFPLLNPKSEQPFNQLHYIHFSVRKADVWDIQTNEQFRLERAQSNSLMRLAPIQVKFGLNDKGEITFNSSSQTRAINLSAIEQSESVEKISEIQSLNLENQTKHNYYQIKHPLLHSIYLEQTICLTLETPHTNNNKMNRYLSAQIKDKNFLVVISLAMNRVLIIQVYDCQSQQQNLISRIKHQVVKDNSKNQQSYKFQSFEIFRSEGSNHGNEFEVQLLTFSKDIASVKIRLADNETIQVLSQTVVKSHQIERKNVNIDFSITLSRTFGQLLKTQIVDILSYCYLEVRQLMGHKQNSKDFLKASDSTKRIENEKMIPFVSLYPKENALLYLSPTNNSVMWKLGNYLKPATTPVFTNTKPAQDTLTQVAMKSFNELEQTQFKYFETIIKKDSNDVNQITTEQQLKVETVSLIGVENVSPSSSVHWLGLGKGALHFYPHQNLKDDQYYLIRTKEGGFVSQGYTMKGKYDNLPVKEGQVQQKLTTQGFEYRPRIFEVHIVYKQLISYPASQKRLDLINGLNGKALISYFLKGKEGFELSYVKLQNNQWFVSEYHPEQELSLITKYELYTNLSNIHQVLYIKREYQLNGNVTHIFKCLDQFYYLQSRDKEGNFGIIRLGVNSMNNRLPRADKKYSGDFQKYMLDEELQTKIKAAGGFSIQQDPLYLQSKVTLAELIPTSQRLQKLYQYDVLPYAVYSDQTSNQILLFNLRELTLKAFDKEIRKSQKDSIGLFILTLLTIETILVALCLSRKQQQIQNPLEKKQQTKKTGKNKKHKD